MNDKKDIKDENVVLLYPPVVLNSTSKFGLPPLGLLYLASSLDKAGIKVCVIDAQIHRMGMDDIINKVMEKKPTIVGITMNTETVLIILEIIKKLKEKDSLLKIVVGGPHVNSTKDEIFEYTTNIDCLVYGEGEETMVELVKNFGKDIPGVIYPNKKFKTRPLKDNLDELPLINLNYIDDYEPYKIFYGSGRKAGSLMTTRGCPYRCIFCNVFVTSGKKYRKMSPDRVIEEIKNLQKNWGINYICFKDSTFTLDREWTTSLCNKILENKLDIEWRCNTRVDLIDRELLLLMKKSGCKCINYGVESGSPRILKILKKDITIERIKEVFKLTHEIGGIETHGGFMIGNPEETLEEVKQTIKLAIELNPHYAAFDITTAFPGTELYDYAISHNLIKDPRWYMKGGNDKENKLIISSKKDAWLKCEFDQEKMISKAYKSYYMRPSFVLRTIKKIIKNPSFLSVVTEAMPEIFNIKFISGDKK
ncbi:MAG: radical SAM protein [Candidatus Nanoarchaeia archaeon]|nr:radical SAM protein [Candidatus Nanoarchaeia archaeon]